MHFPIIHPFTTPFFIYSFFPLSVLSFEIFIYNSTLNINHYIRRHIMPEGAVILTLTKSDVFEKEKNNYGTYDPNGQFKYSLLFLCYSKKTKRINPSQYSRV